MTGTDAASISPDKDTENNNGTPKPHGAFSEKHLEDPKYYLGNDYHFSEEEEAWYTSCSTYVKESIRKVEQDLSIELFHQKVPLPSGCHPELDESDLLDADGIKQYQMLIGMAQWASSLTTYIR